MNRDFTAYDDMLECYRYDGFFDPNGKYYKVKLRNSNMTLDSHNNWAEEFIKGKIDVSKIDIKASHSLLFGLSSINGPAALLVHCLGFVYYSHDPIYYKPIIILPNEKIAGHRVTEEQLNSLFEMMLINRENPYDNPMFLNDEDIEYNGLDNVKKY